MRFRYLATTIVLLSSGAGPLLAQDEPLNRIRARLMAASLRGDSAALARGVADLETLPRVGPDRRAERHYLLGFARWQQTFVDYGARPDIEAIHRSGVAHVDSAIATDSTHARAWAVRGLLAGSRLQPDRVVAETDRWFGPALRLAPDDPVVLLAEAIARSFAPGRGAAPFRRAVEAFERIPPAGGPDWWRPAASALLADALLGNYESFHYAAKGAEVPADPAGAARALDRALALSPGFEFAVEAIAPLVAIHRATPAAELGGLAWRPLGRDSAGDSQFGHTPDLVGLATASRGDLLWFRLELAEPLARDDFGINLALDVDGDSTNGARWWGGRSTFRYDRVVTVWASHEEGDRYRGLVGIGTPHGLRTRRAADLSQEGVRFVGARGSRALYVGVPHALLGAPPAEIRVVAAVGTARWWGDNLPDAGGVRLGR